MSGRIAFPTFPSRIAENSALPGTGDGHGHAGPLDIHKQRASVRACAYSCEFGERSAVHGEALHFARGGDSHHAISQKAVLAHEEISPGGDGEVVAVVDDVVFVGFDEEFELSGSFRFAAGPFLGAWMVAPDLAASPNTTVGAGLSTWALVHALLKPFVC